MAAAAPFKEQPMSRNGDKDDGPFPPWVEQSYQIHQFVLGGTLIRQSEVEPVACKPRLLECFGGPLGIVMRTERGTSVIPMRDHADVDRYNDRLAAMLRPELKHIVASC